jgi:hypothetical protein
MKSIIKHLGGMPAIEIRECEIVNEGPDFITLRLRRNPAHTRYVTIKHLETGLYSLDFIGFSKRKPVSTNFIGSMEGDKILPFLDDLLGL